MRAERFVCGTFVCGAYAGPMQDEYRTVARWRDQGVRVGQERVRLECVRIGGACRVYGAALHAFVDATDTLPTEPIEQRADVHRRQTAVSSALDAAGFLRAGRA